MSGKSWAMRWHFGLFLVCLTGCTQFPELDAHLSPEVEAADYPALVPLEPLLAARSAPPDRGTEIATSVQGRVSALQARANRLRGPVLSGSERARLRQRPGA